MRDDSITDAQASSPAARAWEETARQRRMLEEEQEALADHPMFIPMWLDPETPSREDAQMQETTLGAAMVRVLDGEAWISMDSLIDCLDLSYDLQMQNPDRPGTWKEGSLAALSHVTGNVRHVRRRILAEES